MAAKGIERETMVPMMLCIFVLLSHVPCSSSAPFPEGRAFGGSLIGGLEQDVGAQDNKVHCSRPRSRVARAVLDEYLVPFLEQQKYNLSTKCRLNFANDMFREQEDLKDSLRPTQWQCGYCRKSFRTEEFLDRHFDNRHSDKLDMSPSRCIADVCGAIHCDYFNSQNKVSRKKVCNRAAVERNKHQCQSLANSCFPREEGPAAKKFHEFFLRQFCDAHTCNPGQTYFPRGSGRNRNRALFWAFSLFTIILLIIFYVALYLYRRDMAVTSTTKLKKLAQHNVMDYQAAKRK